MDTIGATSRWEGRGVGERPAVGWDLRPMEEAEEGRLRAEEWNGSLRPWDCFGLFLVAQAAANSLRVERCQHHDRLIRELQAERASTDWDADRRVAAEDLGAKLSAQPSRIARRLERTKHGCEWLLDRWKGLSAALDARGDWDEKQRLLALDLLGTPLELRDAPTPVDADLESRKALVVAQVERLSARLAGGLERLDRLERSAAEQGFGPDTDGELAAVRRHERFSVRRLEWAVDHLKPNRGGPRPDSPGRDRHRPIVHPAPPPPAPKSNEQLMEETRALAARKKAAAAAIQADPPAPKPEPDPAPIVEPAAPIVPELLRADPPPAARNRRERRMFLALARRRA